MGKQGKSKNQKLRRALRREQSELQALRQAAQASQLAKEDLSFSKDQLEKMMVAYRDLLNNVFKLNLAVSDLDASDDKSLQRFLGKLKFFIDDLPRNCEKAGIKMIDFSGREYSPNLSIRVINEEDFTRDERFLIEEMLEPHLTVTMVQNSDENSLGEQVLQVGLVSIRKVGD
jgi:hypothetical protein